MMKLVISEIFFAIDIQNLEEWPDLHNDLLFLPEGMQTEKTESFVANLQDKKEYVIHVTNLKEALNHRLVLKKSW